MSENITHDVGWSSFYMEQLRKTPTAVITIIKGHTDQLPGYLCSLYYFCEKQGGLEFIFNSWVIKSHNKIHIFSYWKFNLKRPFQTAHMIALDQPTSTSDDSADSDGGHDEYGFQSWTCKQLWIRWLKGGLHEGWPQEDKESNMWHTVAGAMKKNQEFTRGQCGHKTSLSFQRFGLGCYINIY